MKEKIAIVGETADKIGVDERTKQAAQMAVAIGANDSAMKILIAGSNRIETAKYFDVHYGESQWGRQIEAKIKANDIQDVIDWIKTTYPAYNWIYEDIQDDDSAYIMIDVCVDCDLNDLDKPLEDNPCEGCEHSAYFDIYSTDDIADELLLIFPTIHSTTRAPMKYDSYHDLTI